MDEGRRMVSFRLSARARRVLLDLARWYGVTRTGVLEAVIRDEARRVERLRQKEGDKR